MKKKLVIVTTHFGTNFSGGSAATCEIFQPLESEFAEVHVVGSKLGTHKFNNLNFAKYRNWFHLKSMLKKFPADSTIFYGDFYNSFVLSTLRIPFFFTYHDNWPELGRFGFKNRLLSIFYTTVYIRIFKRATKVFTVSNFKLAFVKKYSDHSSLIRNGFRKHHPSLFQKFVSPKILMVGNIDSRKYKLAMPLFEKLSSYPDLEVDVFGNVVNRKIAAKLQSYPFVRLKGFSSEIPFKEYSLFLHTSAMENLPMVHCEAIESQIPIVAFDVGGTNEVVNEQNGILIAPYDLKDMTKKIFKVLDKKIIFKFRSNAMPKEFSWQTASKLYKKAILG